MLSRFCSGVLEVVTSSGSLFVKPNAFERLSLLWIFRNFRHLHLGVLSGRNQRTIENIAFKRMRVGASADLIGTVDCRPIGKKPPRPVYSRQLTESAKV